MMSFQQHPTGECPDCGARLFFGLKTEASGWKVYYECGEQCGWEQMAGWIQRAEIAHEDEAFEQAEAMGERWGES